MKSWFARRSDTAVSADGSDQLEAYKEGRRDEHGRLDEAPRPAADRSALNEAYERGRRDGRARRGGSPLLGFLILVVAVIGGIIIYLAIRNGSFTSAGASVDRSISATAQRVQAPIRGAADKTGNALQNAGQTLKNRAGSDPN